MTRRFCRIWSVVGVVVSMAVGAAPAAHASGGTVTAGECSVSLGIGFSPQVSSLPSSTTASGLATPACIANGAATSGWITFTLGSLGAVTCNEGVLVGSGSFSVTGAFSVSNATVVATVVGGVVNLTVEVTPVGGGTQVLATGVLTQDVASTQACVAGGAAISTTRWTGVIVFEDPTVPDAPAS